MRNSILGNETIKIKTDKNRQQNKLQPSPAEEHAGSGDLESLGKAKNVRMVIHNQSQSHKIPAKLGRLLNCPVVEIANAVGAKKEIKTWLELQQYNNRVLLDALEGGKGK